MQSTLYLVVFIFIVRLINNIVKVFTGEMSEFKPKTTIYHEEVL